MNKPNLLIVAAAATLVAACGGDPDPVPVSPLAGVPEAATQTSQGLTNYVTALTTAQGADQAEPIDLSNLAPLPAPDNTEPEPVA